MEPESMTTTMALHARPFGLTSGGPCRASHQVGDLPLAFNLSAELVQLLAEDAWEAHGRNAKTLVKSEDLSILLMTLKDGTRIERHRAAGTVAIQTIAGRLRLCLPNGTVEVPERSLFVIEPNVPHDVEAIGDSAFLLTIVR
jgi:quercetin dioxygenase-like cupin family protein